jgi:hypothetical protein
MNIVRNVINAEWETIYRADAVKMIVKSEEIKLKKKSMNVKERITICHAYVLRRLHLDERVQRDEFPGTTLSAREPTMKY